MYLPPFTAPSSITLDATLLSLGVALVLCIYEVCEEQMLPLKIQAARHAARIPKNFRP